MKDTNKIKLTKAEEQRRVKTISAGGYKMSAISQSRYSYGDYEIVSFYTPYYRNGYSAWNGDIERLEWALEKGDERIYTSSSDAYKKGTKKECVRALEYYLKHETLPLPHTSDMYWIKNGSHKFKRDAK